MSTTTDLRRTSLTVMHDGRELPETWASRLLEVRVQLGLRSIGRATLTFADGGYELAGDNVFALGGEVSITVEGSAVFGGRVHAVASEFRPGVDGVLVVTVHDAAQRLATGSHIKVAQSMTFTDIVTQLCSAAGVRTDGIDVPGDAMPYQLASDTPLGLIDEIAERTGQDWVVDSGKLALWSATTGKAPQVGDVTLDAATGTLQAFAVRRLAGAESTFEVHGWDPANKRAVSGSTTRPQARGALEVHESERGPSATLVDAGATVSSEADARTRADALAARAGRILAQGRADLTPTLRPGGEVTISGVGPGSGTFYVREVTHTFDARGTSTAFVAGDRDPVRLTDPWAAPPAASSFRHTGLVVGVVDKINDPDELGRVSVALQSLDSQVTTAWARVLTLGGGATRGFFVLPEVGDEVLVAFEDDDVSRPVVLGGLFGKHAKAPTVDVAGGAVVTRAFTSRLGHVLELSDGDDDATRHILLKLAGGTHLLRLGKDRAALEVPADVPVTIKSGTSSLAFDGKGNITIEGTKITLKAQQGVELQGTTITAKAQTQLQLGGVQVSVKGDAAVGVEAGGPLTLKGAMVAIN